ncbi:hypothetical protein ACP70R_018034 [Stipagrostis hirtigluma subsp. patula]
MEPEPEAAAADLAPDAAAPESSSSQLDAFKSRIRLLCDTNKGDFDAWVSLINSVEATSADDIDVISLVYHGFLLQFPLCHGYWIKYAAHKARLCTYGDVVEVYEQAIQAIPHSVDLWLLFERALSLVGKDYLCYHLWDKYIEFENSQKQLIQLATVYINTLKFPSKKLQHYYERNASMLNLVTVVLVRPRSLHFEDRSRYLTCPEATYKTSGRIVERSDQAISTKKGFRKLVTLLEQEVTHCGAERSSESIHTSDMMDAEASELDISSKIAGLFDQKDEYLRPEALKQYLFSGERLYQRSSKIDKEIFCFEVSIRRPFFHVKPLDDEQLENWHQYLDFVEKYGDFDWAVKLYERCLIPCANYPEFWIRYAEFVNSTGGREIADYALRRASSCFVKDVPTFCMYYAMFKEQIGDAPGARSLFVKGNNNFASNFYANINRLANMEKRMGNIKAGSEIYETAIEDAIQKQNIELLPDLYTNFARFKYAASRSIGEAKEVFVEGIKRSPCKPLIKGFIQFMSTHGGHTEIPFVESVICDVVTPGSDVSTLLTAEDREDISLLFLEFVDLSGDINELRKAWARHSKMFPHSTRKQSQQYRNSMQQNNKRAEPLEVTHDYAKDMMKLKQSSKRDTYSVLVDKEIESQVDRSTADSGGHGNAGEQNSLGSASANDEFCKTAQECMGMVHGQHSADKPGMQTQNNSYTKQEDSHVSVCAKSDHTTDSQAESEKATQAESDNCDSPPKANTCSEKMDAVDKVSKESASGHPRTVCSKSDLPSGANLPDETTPSSPAQTSQELEEKQHGKIPVDLDPDHDVSIGNTNPEKPNGSPVATQCGREISVLDQETDDHIQSSQPQLTVSTKPSSSEIAKTKASLLCSQLSSDPAVTSQSQIQHQVASQIHQSNNHSLAGESMQQQQGFAYTMPQNVQMFSQNQDQMFAQPNQRNQQYIQTMQGYSSQMWQYYQQQLYYLQSQHNQQMQSLQQQQLPTEHLQQNFTQQVQQLNQQMALWQQQVQQQQQQLPQALPVQQQPDEKQGQFNPSSGDAKHEQNTQKQQASQMDHQSQHLQQQQLLYFQQQQQMYLMQQQQMYQQQQKQQQQLMQQQLYLSQMPQQDLLQQQQLFQQQQQQLFQQQQQQMILMQQQQQQFIQQQMQQYLQQQQNQQGPKGQNYELNPQDRRSQQMDHGHQSEASQSDGSKLRSAEQSELSYTSTPQSQRSNQ